MITESIAVMDPGLPRGGVEAVKAGAPSYYFAQKLYENEKQTGPRGGARTWRFPDPPMHRLI